jgi:hypothetical protein
MGLLEEIRQAKARPIPAGWRTVKQIAKDEGFSESHCATLLKEAVNLDLYECDKGIFSLENGPTVKMNIYRRKKK